MTQEKAPGAIKALVLGALSIAFCWTVVVGLVLGLIARGGPSTAKLENENPGKYTKGSMVLRKIGRILGLVGWPLSILFVIYWGVVIYYMYWGYSDYNNNYLDAIEELQRYNY